MSTQEITAPDSGLRKLILGLAAQEAKAAGFGLIAPAHLLMALGKVAEAIPAAEAGGDAIAGLRAEFGELGIEPRPFRRRLRALASRAGNPAPGDGTVHRSEDVKEIFALAEMLARQENARAEPKHLLRAAVASLAGGSAPAPPTVIRPEAAPAAPSPIGLERLTAGCAVCGKSCS